ncbi:radical SAM protein [Desulfovibrio sp. OttesenSCG-928-C06]|nr:radical SAM protein [Desulfovibrio sp. OttesenSCG-928-C06]
MQAKKFHIITLGCKVNQYESEALREAWLKAGHQELAEPEGADLVLINSCAITAKAVSDLRAMSRRVRRVAPHCELLVTGCAAQALPEELNELPVDTLVPQKEKISLLRWLGTAEGFEAVDASSIEFPTHERHHHDHDHSGADDEHGDGHDDGTSSGHDAADPDLEDFWDYEGPEEVLEENAFPAFSISDYARTRAVLKIHDGCSQHCTYCIVPQGRGPSVSRPWQAVLAEAGRLVAAGFREIVLNGVNLRQYGLDLADTPDGRKPDFWDLLSRLDAAFAPEWARPEIMAKGGLRFRISSLEPGQLNQKALDILGRSKLIAPQLHLSLQSGSPRILKKMGRGHYDPATIPGFLNELRKIWPVYGLGADYITGFPGETEADFEETMRLSSELPLTYAHVFPYSKRPGTAAAKLPDQIPQEVKKERAARLRELIRLKKLDFLQSQLALESVWIVPEEGKAGQGVNEFYSDCRFTGEQTTPMRGKNLVKARPAGVDGETLLVGR